MDKETYYRLALVHFKNYGNANIKKIIKLCGSATALFEQHDLVAAKLYQYRAKLKLPSMNHSIDQFVNEELKYAARNNIKICFFDSDNYPQRLKECSDSPYFFYYKGSGIFDDDKSVAIVGTRNASNYGKDVVKKIVEDLAPHHVSIISGLARGIDTSAHEEALQHQLNTIAVLGCGLRRVYPEENIGLARRIIENGGTVISEFPYDTMPDRMNFPKRNRIIAGMSDAVIVAESQSKGGSIITADIAHSYNRDVFAVPGSIFQKSMDGCHELVRSNLAALVYSGKNVAEMMGWDDEQKNGIQKQLFIELTEDEEAILNLVRQHRDVTIDQIASQAVHMTPPHIASVLLSMELKGVVECKPGKVYTTIY